MIKAEKADEPWVIELLCASFDQNPGVNEVVNPSTNRLKNIRRLITYAVKQCNRYGQIWLSDDKFGCVLILYPFLKKPSLLNVWADARLAITAIGLKRVKRVLKRERLIREKQVKGEVGYVWFIGVHPSAQGKGTGGQLLKEVTEHIHRQQLFIILETNSNTLQWYAHRNFIKYDELQLSYQLHFMVYVHPVAHSPHHHLHW